ncbi:uncharacterized protein LOC121389946 [Gigantopelta aegis]|uniref:uncharacterized protein LOC121389946 n=1 Tax=Gigantopelta aegis TaxID=1735272 RepID=UPI001B88BB8D|nr:uncharacterized protein LOC121389946 [Gigantopelta aegis]
MFKTVKSAIEPIRTLDYLRAIYSLTEVWLQDRPRKAKWKTKGKESRWDDPNNGDPKSRRKPNQEKIEEKLKVDIPRCLQLNKVPDMYLHEVKVLNSYISEGKDPEKLKDLRKQVHIRKCLQHFLQGVQMHDALSGEDEIEMDRRLQNEQQIMNKIKELSEKFRCLGTLGSPKEESSSKGMCAAICTDGASLPILPELMDFSSTDNESFTSSSSTDQRFLSTPSADSSQFCLSNIPSPSHASTDQSPSHGSTDQSPSHVSTDQSPLDQCPSHSCTTQSPSHVSTAQSPSHVSTDQSPLDQCPSYICTAQSPIHVSTAQSPSHVFTDEASSSVTTDTSPFHNSTDQSPSRISTDQSPFHVATEQYPSPISTERKHSHIFADQSPLPISVEQSAFHLSIDQSPFDVDKGQSPSAISTERIPSHLSYLTTRANPGSRRESERISSYDDQTRLANTALKDLNSLLNKCLETINKNQDLIFQPPLTDTQTTEKELRIPCNWEASPLPSTADHDSTRRDESLCVLHAGGNERHDLQMQTSSSVNDDTTIDYYFPDEAMVGVDTSVNGMGTLSVDTCDGDMNTFLEELLSETFNDPAARIPL